MKSVVYFAWTVGTNKDVMFYELLFHMMHASGIQTFNTGIGTRIYVPMTSNKPKTCSYFLVEWWMKGSFYTFTPSYTCTGADPGFDQGGGGAQIVTGLKLPFWGLSFVEFWCWGLIFGGQGGARGPPWIRPCCKGLIHVQYNLYMGLSWFVIKYMHFSRRLLEGLKICT